ERPLEIALAEVGPRAGEIRDQVELEEGTAGADGGELSFHAGYVVGLCGLSSLAAAARLHLLRDPHGGLEGAQTRLAGHHWRATRTDAVQEGLDLGFECVT